MRPIRTFAQPVFWMSYLLMTLPQCSQGGALGSSMDGKSGAATLTGIVRVDGEPYPGARVSMAGDSVETDAEGAFEFIRCLPGQYPIVYSLKKQTAEDQIRSADYRCMVSIGAQDQGRLSIDLPTGSARIRFLDIEGKPLQGMFVCIRGQGQLESAPVVVTMEGGVQPYPKTRLAGLGWLGATTDSEGYALFPRLVAGDYGFSGSDTLGIVAVRQIRKIATPQFKDRLFRVRPQTRLEEVLVEEATVSVSGRVNIDLSDLDPVQDLDLPKQLFTQILFPKPRNDQPDSFLASGGLASDLTWKDGVAEFRFDSLVPGRHAVEATRYRPTRIQLKGVLDVDRVTSKIRLTLKASRPK